MKIGPYNVIRLLGKGGMAQVHLARDEGGGPPVALKVVASSELGGMALLRRLKREFRACQSIDHPNVVRVFGYGVEEGRAFYAMEYLPHPTLREILTEEGALPLRRALGYGADLCRALVAVHGAGVVHRDIKPSNIIITSEDRLVLLDFGLVGMGDVTRLTATGSVVGTPRYLAPETYRGEEADERTDVFGLGLVLYEMLTARFALDGESIGAIGLASMQGEAQAAVEGLGITVPKAVTIVLRRSLATDRLCRYPGAAPFLEDLECIEAGGFPPARDDLDEAIHIHGDDSFDGDESAASLPEEDPTAGGRGLMGVLPYVVVAIVILALVAVLRFRSPPAFEIKKLVVTKGRGAIRIGWISARPYKSRIELSAPSAPVRLCEGTVDAGGVHRVEIDGLKGRRNYRFSILLPDGKRSLWRDLRLERFVLRPVSARQRGESLHLAWSTSLSVICRVSAVWADGRTKDYPCRSEGGRSHVAKLDLPTPAPMTSLAVQSRDALGGRVTTDLGKVYSKSALRIAKAFDFDPAKVTRSIPFVAQQFTERHQEFMKDFKERFRSATERERFQLTNVAVVDRFLKDKGFLPPLADLRSSAAFLLSNTLTGLDEKMALYGGVNRYSMLRLAVVGHYGLPLISDLSLPLGLMGSRRESRMPQGSRSFVKDFAGPGRTLSTLHPGIENPYRIRVSFPLKGVARAHRAEISLRYTGLSRESFFRCLLNGKHGVSICNSGNPFSKEPLFTEVDVRMLREGANEVELKFFGAPGTIARDTCSLHSLSFRLWP